MQRLQIYRRRRLNPEAAPPNILIYDVSTVLSPAKDDDKVLVVGEEILAGKTWHIFCLPPGDSGVLTAIDRIDRFDDSEDG